MKKNLSVLFSVLVSLVVLFCNSAVLANTKPPRPPADCGKDADRDGWCVEDPDRGNKLVGNKDCNDADKAVNPGADEILDDDIDQDCDGIDLTAPKYLKNFGCSTAACVKRVIAEIAVCEADQEHCAVDRSSGKLITQWGYYMIDSDCDGTRELLDQVEKDKYDTKVKQGFRCVSKSYSGGAKKSGSGDVPAKSVAPKSDPKVGELEGKVTALDTRVGTLETGMAGLSGQVDGFDSELDALDEALEAEEKARIEGDERLTGQINEGVEAVRSLDTRVGDVEKSTNEAAATASSALESAEMAHSTGVSAGLDVGVMVIGQSDIKLKGGQQARPGVAPTILIGGHVGAETESGLYRALGAIGVPYETAPEGNTENGFLVTLGAEALFKVARGSAHSVGPVVRFIQHESGGDVLGVNAMSRGGSAGVAYELSPSWGRFRTPIHASLEGGYEQLGTKGDNFTAIGNAPMALLTVTFGAGVGSAIR